MSDNVPCPKCGSTNVKEVTYTWWGGFLGPKLLNHVKCNDCKTTYNGKSGESNTNGIIIYSVVMFAISIIALAACCGLFVILPAMSQ